MSYQAKRELLLQIAPRYREASSRLKEVILDEFVAATGYARKYAIRLLNHPAEQKLTITRPRPRRSTKKSRRSTPRRLAAASMLPRNTPTRPNRA